MKKELGGGELIRRPKEQNNLAIGKDMTHYSKLSTGVPYVKQCVNGQYEVVYNRFTMISN